MSAKAVPLACLLLALAACTQSRIVLLDNGRPGAVTIQNNAGTKRLDRPGEAVEIWGRDSLARPITLTRSEIDEVWGDAIATLPPLPVKMTLYFAFGTAKLMPSSRPMLADIVLLIRQRPAPEISIVGYTDRSGSADYNYRLGLRRAKALRAALVAAGVRPDTITVASDGNTHPLVRSADPYQPRNRRVALTIR